MGVRPVSEGRRVDLLYLACNRLEFTRETFATLLANTDWGCVRQLFVCDDGSRDGTREWLDGAARQAPASVRVLGTRFGSPVAAMAHFIESAEAPVLAKTDNDVMLPPGWLRQSLAVLDRHPQLSLLGIEALYPPGDGPDVARSYAAAEFVSGLGLYRRCAFARTRPAARQRWFGFEEWQAAQGPGLVRGWITPALPVFLLDRLPFAPWAAHTASYVRRGWQRRWPPYDPACPLWHWRWPAAAAPAAPEGDPRFLCALRVKNEAEHIEEVIRSVLPLCRRVFVLDDHSADATPDLCRSFGDRVTLLPSPFEGLDEARDKNYLLRPIVAAAPEWVLWIDGDEVLERCGPERLRRAAEHGPCLGGYSLRVAYLWGDAQTVRVDGIYGRFHRPSYFRLKGQPADRLHFPASGYGGNFHCGNVPQGLLGGLRELDVRLKHYGYVTEEQRLAKYRWYNAVDPNNAAEDCYRHLAGAAGARFAPGPPRLLPWTE